LRIPLFMVRDQYGCATTKDGSTRQLLTKVWKHVDTALTERNELEQVIHFILLIKTTISLGIRFAKTNSSTRTKTMILIMDRREFIFLYVAATSTLLL
jgi:hypothetical protein